MAAIRTAPELAAAITRIAALPAADRDAAIDAFCDDYAARNAPRWLDATWLFVRVEYAASGLNTYVAA
jgi:hypothetical protein